VIVTAPTGLGVGVGVGVGVGAGPGWVEVGGCGVGEVGDDESLQPAKAITHTLAAAMTLPRVMSDETNMIILLDGGRVKQSC
jgi:hypothetical protein